LFSCSYCSRVFSYITQLTIPGPKPCSTGHILPKKTQKMSRIPGSKKKSTPYLRQRTVDLVRSSVDALCKDKQRVSLSTIVAKSKELDAEGKGISESAILDNQEARAYYEQHRSWRGPSRKRAKTLAVAISASPGTVKADRDEQRVRQRYLRMGKEALIERLIVAERSLAEQRERWLGQQDKALTW
jgi:hypothetical protein